MDIKDLTDIIPNSTCKPGPQGWYVVKTDSGLELHMLPEEQEWVVNTLMDYMLITKSLKSMPFTPREPRGYYLNGPASP